MSITADSPVILQIIPHLDTGGAEISTVEVAEAISKAGGRALVASQGGRLESELFKAGGVLIPFSADTKNPLKILNNAFQLRALMRKHGVKLLHARSRAPAWSALLAARLTGTPFVTTYHGAYNQKGPIKGFYNSVMARGDFVIANSAFTADMIRSRHTVAQDRLTVIHRGVDHSRFAPARVSDARTKALRDSWDVKPGEKIVLQAARLTRWKGQEVVIDAAARLKAANALDDVVFILAGDEQGRTQYVTDLQARIASHGLAGKVRLVGHCHDMPAAYGAAHIVLIASIEPEAFGRTATEAQAMGCPVVASKDGGLTETVCDANNGGTVETTGWLVPPGDADALAASLALAMALTVEERAAMGARAIDHVSRNFSKESLQHKTLSLYDALLGGSLADSYRQFR
jgi:glycosyltransferase involved in cell wall biosynthesis